MFKKNITLKIIKNTISSFFSTYKLKILQFLHIKPINVIIYYILKKIIIKVSFSLRCFQ